MRPRRSWFCGSSDRMGWVTISAVGNKLLYDLLDSISNSVNDPPMSLATIRNEIEKLGPAERASLIDLLWDSLDDDCIQEVEAIPRIGLMHLNEANYQPSMDQQLSKNSARR